CRCLLRCAALDGVVDRRAQVEGAVEPRDLENLPHAGLVAHDAQLATLRAGPLEDTDEDAQSGRVEERDLVEVRDQVLVAFREEAVELLPQARSGGDVDLAAHGEHRPVAFGSYDEAKIHDATTLPDGPRSPCSHPCNYTGGTRNLAGAMALLERGLGV